MRKLTKTVTVDVSVDADLGTARIPCPVSGLLRRFYCLVPDLTGAAALTVTFSLEDDDGFEMYSNSGNAEDTALDDTGLSVPIVPSEGSSGEPMGIIAKVTLSGDEGADQDFPLVLYLDDK